MNNREFITALSESCGIQAAEAEQRTDRLLSVMKKLWMDGDSISISGFGVMEVKKKAERVSVNPNSGQRMLIPPRLVLTYKPSALLKVKINTEK